jgi:hypothetical protein
MESVKVERPGSVTGLGKNQAGESPEPLNPGKPREQVKLGGVEKVRQELRRLPGDAVLVFGWGFGFGAKTQNPRH